MKIVLTGGGSGGHITPILAVARELKALQPDVELIYVGQRGDQLLDVPAESPYIDTVYAVRAGKFRRYHGEGIKQVFDIPTLLKNIRDAWFTVVGTAQSYRLLGRLKPDVVFIKGGFVGVPVGLAAAKRHVPFITHDSDTLPGLANRIIARWAAMHAVALPAEVYPYPSEKTVTVGVPVQAEFTPVSARQQAAYRQEIGLPAEGQLLFVTGGGNGARSLNQVVADITLALLTEYPNLYVIHVAGRLHEAALGKTYDGLLPPSQRNHVRVEGFITKLHAYSGAADVIITRAGGTSLAEFAVQHKACIVVPNPVLTGGHQVKNARYLADKHAAICVTEAELTTKPGALDRAIRRLLDNPKERQAMAERLGTFAKADAAKALAVLLLEQAKK
jgi:UDP-N-acetylglucosamine--N-acetylmuramyl-(pentapeptide) pyrophosphoryl-undecaprenol N-acetylglucosamine transferase